MQLTSSVISPMNIRL